MKLDAVARTLGVNLSEGSGGTEVTELVYDSRATIPGSLFFCLRGQVRDGHDHAGEAVRGGAKALVTEQLLSGPAAAVPQLVVADSRAAMASVAAEFYGHPSRALALAGVTGTNGKTTLSFMLDSIFRAGGGASGLIGTVQVRVGDEVRPAGRTTPESVDTQRLLKQMVDLGVSRCALEVTSIGLDRGRTTGLEFDVAVFTNLTHDHLDYHGDMESYFAAKARLFLERPPRAAVVNVDDPYGRRLAADLAYPVLRYAVKEEADVFAVDLAVGRLGSSFRVMGCGLDQPVRLPLPGEFNVSNALGAVSAALKMGVEPEAIAFGLESLSRVPGRFESVDRGQDFLVAVDYAHTPDALVNVLTAGRALTEGRVIVVFGCGGDRDRAKRAPMGAAAARLSDLAIATSDNPRSEDPLRILDDIEKGMRTETSADGYLIVPDRAQAIGEALAAARRGDVVLIAGKGHETGQEIGGRISPFDDRRVAASLLEAMA